MEFTRFEEIQQRFQELYRQGEFFEALDLAEQAAESFPDYAHLLYYWRITLAARTGDTGRALDLLREVLDTGFWYGETLLRKSPSLEPLQGMEEFERLVEMNAQMREKDPTEKYPVLILRSEGKCQAGGEPCPLLIGLHANGVTARDSVEFWQPAATSGWLVGAPQSSQAMWRGAFVWDDREIAEKEITKHYRLLTQQYNVNRNRVVLAGHSMGGETAIWLALTGAIRTQGFIAIGAAGPYMNQPESWLPLIHENQNPLLRGYLLYGEEDETIPTDGIHTLAAMLEDGGISCEVERIAHAGHDYLPEYESGILRALDFIAS